MYSLIVVFSETGARIANSAVIWGEEIRWQHTKFALYSAVFSSKCIGTTQ